MCRRDVAKRHVQTFQGCHMAHVWCLDFQQAVFWLGVQGDAGASVSLAIRRLPKETRNRKRNPFPSFQSPASVYHWQKLSSISTTRSLAEVYRNLTLALQRRVYIIERWDIIRDMVSILITTIKKLNTKYFHKLNSN